MTAAKQVIIILFVVLLKYRFLITDSDCPFCFKYDFSFVASPKKKQKRRPENASSGFQPPPPPGEGKWKRLYLPVFGVVRYLAFVLLW